VPLDRSKALGNSSSEVHPYQQLEKFVPLDRFTEGKEVSLSQSRHALAKVMSSSAWVENVTAGKEVKLASLQPFHASVKFVPLLKSNAGKDSSAVHSFHVAVKSMSSSA